MATSTATQPRLKARYNNTIKAQLAKDLGINNEMQIPKLDKIVINMGVGRATQQPSLLEKAVEHFNDVLPDQTELGFAETTRRAGGGAKAHAGSDEGFLGIEWNAVLVAGDVGATECGFGALTGGVLGTEVDQHQMVVGAARDDIEPVLHQRRRERACVGDDLAGVGFELGLQRFLERHRLRRDDVHQWAALQAGEHR